MEQVIKDVLIEMGKRINQRVVKRWMALNNIQGNAYANEPTFEQEIQDAITMTLSYGGQKAWVAEFGRGSLMADEPDNPFIKRYKNSVLFNKARLSPLNSRTKVMSIVSREPKSTYKDLDGNTHTATEKFPKAGFNLEHWAETGKAPHRKYFKPSPPLYIIATEIKLALREIKTELQKATRRHITKLITSQFPK